MRGAGPHLGSLPGAPVLPTPTPCSHSSPFPALSVTAAQIPESDIQRDTIRIQSDPGGLAQPALPMPPLQTEKKLERRRKKVL